MSDEALIARLRELDGWVMHGAHTHLAAADRIEALTKEREQWRRAAETRAEGWKISDDARIEAEAKLAKVVEALERIEGQAFRKARATARATLAEIKGENHE